jgi:RimJ/RimL family protein N-acetyltransferase
LYFWVIAELGTNKAIGSVSLRLVGKPEDKKIRLGIAIADKSKWGKGYGREVLITMIDFAFYRLGVNRLELSCFSPNIRALKCYNRCGFVENHRQKYRWKIFQSQ